MKAIIIPVGAMPRTFEIDGSLKSMQEVVDGNIELCSWVFNDQPAVYVNEEGKYACEPNRAVYATKADEGCIKWDGSKVKEGDLLEILFGDVLCVGYDPETGEDRDVTDEEIRRVNERFGTAWSIESGLAETLRIRLQARAACR